MIKKFINFRGLFLSVFFFSTSFNVSAQNEEAATGAYEESDVTSICPLPTVAPIKSITDIKLGEDIEDPNQELKDLSTTFVNNSFFTSQDTLFNFMELVYGNINAALEDYREELDLDEKSLFLVFKGGNILRIVANGVFDLLSPEARNFLSDKYAEYFKRSDADFSVYLDELKLKELDLDYDRTLAELTEIILGRLGKIRDQFQANSQKYFNFFQLTPKAADKELSQFLDELYSLKAVEDPNNANWYGAKFRQLQLLDRRAKPEPRCPYDGGYDFRSVTEEGKVVRLRLSAKTDWIVNSDNRTIVFSWGSDPTKFVKFFLLRSKVSFDTIFEKDGDTKRRPILGELVDISIPHKGDARLRSFLNNYDMNVSIYRLISESGKQLTLKSYSLSNLAEDLQFIIFDSFLRPWQGGPKYEKRMHRLFFLHLVEMLSQFGLGSPQINGYVNDVRDKILKHLDSLYPINDDSSEVATKIKKSATQISKKWKNMSTANKFWVALANFVQDRLIDAPQEDDQAGFTKFLETIKKNIDNAAQLGRMTPTNIDIEKIYNVEMKNLL